MVSEEDVIDAILKAYVISLQLENKLPEIVNTQDQTKISEFLTVTIEYELTVAALVRELMVHILIGLDESEIAKSAEDYLNTLKKVVDVMGSYIEKGGKPDEIVKELREARKKTSLGMYLEVLESG